MKNVYSEIWKKLEKKFKLPTRARNLISLDFSEFAKKIDSEELSFANQITRSLIEGDIYILKNAFDKKFFERGKEYKPEEFEYKLDKKGKFGRVLGSIIADDLDLNQTMIEKHLAVAYFGQSKNDIEAEHLVNRQKLIDLGQFTPVGE